MKRSDVERAIEAVESEADLHDNQTYTEGMERAVEIFCEQLGI